MNSSAFMILAAITLSAASTAPAATFTLQDEVKALGYLKDYNVITFGSFTTRNHVDGRVFVGGAFAATDAVIDMKNPANPNGTAALTVGGSASFGQNGLNVKGADVRVGGATSGKVNLNGGGSLKTGLAAGDITGELLAIKAALTGYSSYLSTLTETSPSDFVTTSQGKAVYAPLAGLNVINISASDLTGNEIGFSALNGFTVINVSGTTINPGFNNFLGNNASYGEKVLWNFYEATSVTLGDWGGSVLAVNANFTKDGRGGVNGTIVANNILGQQAEIRLGTYGGPTTLPPPVISPVPEASTWAMMLIGFGAIGAAVRARRKAARARLSVAA